MQPQLWKAQNRADKKRAVRAGGHREKDEKAGGGKSRLIQLVETNADKKISAAKNDNDFMPCVFVVNPITLGHRIRISNTCLHWCKFPAFGV